MPDESETPANVADVGQPTSEAPLAATHGSEAAAEKQRSYAKGYIAGQKTVDQSHVNALKSKVYHLQSEVERLKRENAARPGEYEGTVNYLICTSETFLKAAEVMLGFREKSSPQNSD